MKDLLNLRIIVEPRNTSGKYEYYTDEELSPLIRAIKESSAELEQQIKDVIIEHIVYLLNSKARPIVEENDDFDFTIDYSWEEN